MIFSDKPIQLRLFEENHEACYIQLLKLMNQEDHEFLHGGLFFVPWQERIPHSPFFDGFGPLDIESGALVGVNAVLKIAAVSRRRCRFSLP